MHLLRREGSAVLAAEGLRPQASLLCVDLIQSPCVGEVLLDVGAGARPPPGDLTADLAGPGRDNPDGGLATEDSACFPGPGSLPASLRREASRDSFCTFRPFRPAELSTISLRAPKGCASWMATSGTVSGRDSSPDREFTTGK